MNLLEQLKSMTVVVADTGDFDSIAKYAPRRCDDESVADLSGRAMPQYQRLIDEAIEATQAVSGKEQKDGGGDRSAVCRFWARGF